MTVTREIVESPVPQGVDEIIAYKLNTAQWGGSASTPPSSPAVVVYDVTDGDFTDVTNTVMSTNTPSVVDVFYIQLSVLELLTTKKKYRVEIKFTISGNVFEAFVFVNAER